ncbi:hypothetical protein GWK47_019003 [Chionoecetes opilio]|uniref:Uncharacterized protein n=1 Tax=Chionoecetes opilio TaxID=41210 RepID=A0A8J4XUN1_CHIOP|nr:hypothetical protein GWK47_019003 [Chionoecetes opilio]
MKVQVCLEIKANLTRCVGIIGAHKADFSALTLDDFQPKKSGPDDEGFEIGSFLKKFKVAKRHTFGMLECMLNESGEIPKVKACLAATQATTNPESGATTQAP